MTEYNYGVYLQPRTASGMNNFIITGFFLFNFSCSKDPVRQRPNIVLIMADDLGVDVLSAYGGRSYLTPNIDHLAATGMRFTHCYSEPMCAPSRVKIMTGRYTFRTTDRWGYIPPEEITFGHVLSKAGYKVALAGKWQMALLKDDPDHVAKMGFAENIVFGWHEGPRYYKPFLYENGKIKAGVEDQYGPDIFCNFLIEFIERNKDKPFLAYYPMALAHEISNDFTPPPPVGPRGRYDSYKEQVEYLDKLVGRLVAALDRLDLREKTLILFTGDNGTPRQFITKVENGISIREPVYSLFADTLIQGGKGLMTDGGTHVPLIANWTGMIAQGSLSDHLIDFSDFMPTLADLAGSPLPEGVIIDGRSFAALLRGQKAETREWIYDEFREEAWIRNKEWKLYRDGRFIDVRNDPVELHP
jgi:arylsulfatase A-like enzyme